MAEKDANTVRPEHADGLNDVVVPTDVTASQHQSGLQRMSQIAWDADYGNPMP
ncbi:hypothetical protein [Heliophilum fasciatum]|uniref:Uncharacterized protein n=1 Tax=Heliophilum fasciatum TaxID=35700 RepID=A0A4R2SBX7_9FIRM|nr:hypothetical protein [Heliophilum fasciatum]MCW2276864.1 hypothetical protein [Heliophilum fasciatum]TCP68675.1 hypothetical protein EDD73_10271 [Heliophilum fasciatum]